IDSYGRQVPKHARGTANMGKHASSTRLIMEKTLDLFDRIVDENLLIRRLSITANHLLHEKEVDLLGRADQLTLFDQTETGKNIKQEDEREKKMQKALLEIKNKFGSNAILKGTSYMEGATGKERNATIGGHKA
ncbi:MAG: DNA methylase, partial [Firmicutes bacterium]|nr:DNA methylase [Bacillota bacterium]